MPPHKDIEKEIVKINKEIDHIKWQLKNKVLTPRQRDSKLEKLRRLKATQKDLTKQVEGWRVKRVTSQKQ